MFLHTGERPYRCQSCQSSFTARDRLKGHILKHHPNHPAAQELQQPSKKPSQQPTEEETISSIPTCSSSIAATAPANFILQWPATLHVGADGNLCWQAASFDASAAVASHFNEVPNIPQVLIQPAPTANPLDVAIKEIIEVSNEVSPSTDKLKCSKTNGVPRETVFVCDKCGREYKYKSFLQVHQKRKCW